jgi:stage II sporulation protein D
VILAAYHANAGGHTAPTDQAWPGSYRLEYLTPVPSPYDVVAADLHYPDCYQWTVTATADQIRQRVRSVTGKEVGAVREVRVSPWETGRIMDLHIIGARGEARVWRPHDVRVVLGLTGQDTGESYDHDTRLVSVHTGKDGFVITGYGAGEGVGLSQHGAIGMARAGISYQQILGHYYRGVALAQDYGRGARRPLPPPDLTDPALPAGEKLARAR